MRESELMARPEFPPYVQSLAGSLLGARKAIIAPIRPHLRAANVTEPQWRVLRVLADVEELSVKDLVEQAMLHRPTVTRILKNLAGRGYIQSQVDGQDGRRLVVSVTAIGREKVLATSKEIADLINGYRDEFGEERMERFQIEAAAFVAALKRLNSCQ